MIIFLYGEDTYRSKQKLNWYRDKFIEKYTATNLEIYEGDFDLAKLKNTITTPPLLSDKRLIIIKNLFKTKDKDLLEGIGQILTNIPKETILIFWEEGTPDKRTTLFKMLSKEKSEEFERLHGYKLLKWVSEEVSKNGGKISAKGAEKLISYIGDDLAQMENEIAKLVAFKGEKEITPMDIEILVKAKLSSDIFDLVDAIGERNYNKAIRYVYELLSKGENEIYVLTMIERQIRNLLLVSGLSKKFNKSQITEETGLHPYVVQKTLLQVKNFKLGELKAVYQKLFETDTLIKTGKREARLALNLLIKEICYEK